MTEVVEGTDAHSDPSRFPPKLTTDKPHLTANLEGSRVLLYLLEIILEPASGNATPMAKLSISPRVLGNVVFVHP